MSNSFTHLHVHTEYSKLDGACRVGDIFKKAQEDGMTAVASTDHGNMSAVPEAVKEAEKHGIQYIPGCELYIEPEANGVDRNSVRSNRAAAKEAGNEADAGKQYYHMTSLAQNQVGYKNLIKIQSRSWLDNYYYQPMTSLEMLSDHSEGIIATTSCLGGVILQNIMAGKQDKADDHLNSLIDILGKENVFVELQRHEIKEQDDTNPILLDMAKRFNLKALATNDCHYTNCSDHGVHDALLCIQTRAKVSEPSIDEVGKGGRFKFKGGPGAHAFKTAAEMRYLFKDLPELCDNTLLVAEMCDPIQFSDGSYKMPKFPLPEGFKDEATYLRHLVQLGLEWRYGSNLTKKIQERADFELKTIIDMGFPGYFLIIWDLVKYAREQGIRVGLGRGSAAGCLIAFCLRITNIDPIKYDLLFERFLNPSRISMPDIDIDFDTRYRDMLIDYTIDRYGTDKVAQIVTFSRIKAKSGIRDATRVLDKPFALGGEISRAMPKAIHGFDAPIKECLAETPSEKWADHWQGGQGLRDLYHTNPEAKEVLDTAMGLDGLMRGTGVHAAAVVISDEPLVEYLPLMKMSKKPKSTQVDMNAVEDLGLVKMDYLGLRNLDVLSETLRIVKETRGIDVDIDPNTMNMDDKKTYDMLSAGKGVGVFQFEGASMRQLMADIKPQNEHSLAALTALYRPGPMELGMHNEYAKRKHGKSPITYLHEDAKQILSETYGILTFQEDIMNIAQKFAGYDKAEADNLRKGMGKKIPEVVAKHKDKFYQGCIDNGYPESLANSWWELIEPFAAYGFPRSHAFSYAITSYQTAYLKANYTAEYLSALLASCKGDDIAKSGLYIFEAKNFDIRVVPPCINQSNVDFYPVTEDSIVIGLSSIKNIGDSPAAQIIKERQKGGPYQSFVDFITRNNSKAANKKVVDALVKSGAFDSLHPRGGLMQVYQEIFEGRRGDRKYRDAGVISFFDEVEEVDNPIPDVKLDSSIIIALEKELLGMYVSEHPLDGFQEQLEANTSHFIEELIKEDFDDFESWLDVCGVISSIQEFTTRKGDKMAKGTIEDLTGSMEFLIWPRTWSEMSPKPTEDQVVKFGCKRDTDNPKILANTVTVLRSKEPKIKPKVNKVQINLDFLSQDDFSDENIESLKSMLQKYKGTCRVIIAFTGGTKVLLPEEYTLSTSAAVMANLKSNLDFVSSVHKASLK